ncbi:PAC2 family-domain-containing protein [Lentinula aciculospora]|uniref:Proteasome assembly chaperone 2 n=1 Tax=Lentinula aciculospora TaxID=153920 RepID=A0A9W9AJJ6_9AGAR|nr:PAC2 family-domain-containing protein [Lentinula aciculospora]
MPFTTESNLFGKTLIIPIISTANVAQLSVDLLITSLGLVRIAVLDSKYFIPLVGSRENEELGITTPFELYGKDGLDIVILQQRSPTLRAKKQEFIDDFFDFAQRSGIASVIIMSGIDPSNRLDKQMITATYQLQPIASSLSSTPLRRLNDVPIPKYTSPITQNPGTTEPQIPFIPGGGITRRMLSSLPKSWSIPLVALLRFALDGDNRADAYSLASIVVQILGIDLTSIEWKQPESWSGLFGTPHDQSLYG